MSEHVMSRSISHTLDHWTSLDAPAQAQVWRTLSNRLRYDILSSHGTRLTEIEQATTTMYDQIHLTVSAEVELRGVSAGSQGIADTRR